MFIRDLTGGNLTKEGINFVENELPLCLAFAFWHCVKWEDESVWTVAPWKTISREAAHQADRIVERIRQSAQEQGAAEFDPDLCDHGDESLPA